MQKKPNIAFALGMGFSGQKSLLRLLPRKGNTHEGMCTEKANESDKISKSIKNSPYLLPKVSNKYSLYNKILLTR